jgi:hypothetical protein
LVKREEWFSVWIFSIIVLGLIILKRGRIKWKNCCWKIKLSRIWSDAGL